MSDIPVIDINAPLSAEEIGKKLVDAAEYHGFVYIRNLGKDIPIAAIDKQFEIVSNSHLNLSVRVTRKIVQRLLCLSCRG
jgi:isopenicillin N synthase-like dioxygenase